VFNLEFEIKIGEDKRSRENYIHNMYGDILEILPSKKEASFLQLIGSFTLRQTYISTFGYIAITEEMIKEIQIKFKKLGIQEFLELEAGTGFLTKVLNDSGFKGVGLSLEIPKDKHHWGLKPSPIYEYCLEKNLLILGDITKQKMNIPELVLVSWIPPDGGEEVIQFFKNNKTPSYFAVIGEDGGCTDSAKFREWLDNEFRCIDEIEEYQSFYGIYDRFKIYEKRKK